MKMKIKRALRAAVPLIGTIAIAGPFGFPPIPVLLGIALSILTYNYWDVSYTTGKQVYQVVQEILPRTRITEVKMPSPPPAPEPEARVRHDAPTVSDLAAHKPTLTPTEVLDPEVVARQPAPQESGFLVGTNKEGKTVYMPRMTSVWVSGVGGSGKTVDVVGLCTQAVPMYKGNVRFAVIDPHMNTNSPETLVARMSPLSPFYLKIHGQSNPVSGGSAALQMIRCLDDEVEKRLDGGDSSQALMVVVDEVTGLFDEEALSAPLRALLLKINEHARKVHIFAIIASQQLKSTRIQGTELRNTVATFLIHNMPAALARQVVPEEYAYLSNRLQVGQAIYSSMGSAEVLDIPNIGPEKILATITPYLPDDVMEELQPREVVGVLEPGIAEVKRVWETYQMLNRELDYSEDSVIMALAVHLYPGDPCGEDRVRRALELGQEHL